MSDSIIRILHEILSILYEANIIDDERTREIRQRIIALEEEAVQQ